MLIMLLFEKEALTLGSVGGECDLQPQYQS